VTVSPELVIPHTDESANLSELSWRRPVWLTHSALEDDVIATRGGAGPVRRGVTLLEMLVVVVIMGLLAKMSLGRTGGLIASYRLTRAAQAFAAELQSGYAIVGRTRKPVSFVWDGTLMELRIVDRNNTKFRRRNFGSDSEFKLTSANITPTRTSLEVYPPGLAADSLSVVFSKDGISRRVRMLRGGLVQVCASGATNTC
jgi:prepilin-type N-terminal cleavage/methylation domain-containing protein